MPRIYNKINLPTNTTDIQMFVNYLRAIDEKGIVNKNEEQAVFANVKIASSRKDVSEPKKDTHTKQTLSLFGLIDIVEDGGFKVSNLGKELIAYYDAPESHTEEKRAALMLKVFMRWAVHDEQFNRHMHPGYLVIKLLCDEEIGYYFTNQEFSNFVMNGAYTSDSQYEEIKKDLLAFRSGVGISEYVAQSKAGTFLSTFVGNWNFLNAEDISLSTAQTRAADKCFKQYLNSEETECEEDERIDTEEVEISLPETSELTASQKNAYSAFHTIKRYSLIGIASYIAHLYLYLLEGNEIIDYKAYFTNSGDCKPQDKNTGYLQCIYYGAPGTGKSYFAHLLTKGKPHIRTIFHPDSDYASFVGCYKPVMEDGRIVYKYRPQAFVNAYVNAWLTDEPYYLVIEEINRGNCAQIFGDIFQLLDRTNGESDYEVHPDTDLKNYLADTFAKPENQAAIANKGTMTPEEILSGTVMRLPSNLNIIATMNTSDQSLFPMDSAFKRRWGWKFFSIKDGQKGYKIQITENGPLYDWWETIKALNEKIYATTKSADKQLGYWFAKVPEGQTIIDKDTFVSKVVFYLWNDVFKDYGFGDNNAFTPETKFEAFYDDEGNVIESTIEAFIKRALNIIDTPLS